MKVLYNLFLLLYPLGARILSVKNDKARKWLQGRRNTFDQLRSISQEKKIIWVHCSSLGEFEQGKPLIEKLRHEFVDVKIVLTFFSPSGYEVQKNYTGADHIFYLPLDSQQNAIKFFDIVNPALAVFIKYEFWYYFLAEAKKRNIPLILASGIFRSSQPFFNWYGDFHRRMLQSISYFFVQDDNSATLLKNIGISNVAVTGDTRFDRVLEIEKQFQPIPLIEQFCGSSTVIVAGSTWTEDDEELDHFANANPNIRFIIAPHDISKARIDECLELYKNAIRFSEFQQTSIQHPASNHNVLVIDNIGLLSKLYHYATICYVGGGFGGDGVHNVLEAAVYGRPVVFGPVYEKYIEAVELVERGGAFSVKNAIELEKQLTFLLANDQRYTQASIASKAFVHENAGATEKIIRYIQEKRLFTT